MQYIINTLQRPTADFIKKWGKYGIVLFALKGLVWLAMGYLYWQH